MSDEESKFRRTQRLAQIAFCEAIANGLEDTAIEKAQKIFGEEEIQTSPVEAPWRMLVTTEGKGIPYPHDFFHNTIRENPFDLDWNGDVKAWRAAARKTANDLQKEFLVLVYDPYCGWEEEGGRFETTEKALEYLRERSCSCYEIFHEDSNRVIHSNGSPEQEDHSAWLQRCPR